MRLKFLHTLVSVLLVFAISFKIVSNFYFVFDTSFFSIELVDCEGHDDHDDKEKENKIIAIFRSFDYYFTNRNRSIISFYFAEKIESRAQSVLLPPPRFS